MELEIRQKQINEIKVRKKTLGLKFKLNIGAAKTNKFFIHCLGLQEL